jgi:hypothetical protein
MILAHGKIAKIARARSPALLLAIALVFGLGAYTGAAVRADRDHTPAHPHPRPAHRPRLFLSVWPARDTIVAGSTAGYRITIRRVGFTGPVRIRVTGDLPPGTDVRFSPSSIRRATTVLTIGTSSRAAPGTYRLHLRARGGGLHRTALVTLTVGGGGDGRGTTTVALPAYQISGDVGAPLWPGVPRAIDLTITNAASLPLSVTGLAVQIANVTSPRAMPALPCSAADFAVQQYSGPYPLVIPASSTRSLKDLRIPAAAWPQVAIIDLPTDQDGCQGASLTFAYDGRATLG